MPGQKRRHAAVVGAIIPRPLPDSNPSGRLRPSPALAFPPPPELPLIHRGSPPCGRAASFAPDHHLANCLVHFGFFALDLRLPLGRFWPLSSWLGGGGSTNPGHPLPLLYLPQPSGVVGERGRGRGKGRGRRAAGRRPPRQAWGPGGAHHENHDRPKTRADHSIILDGGGSNGCGADQLNPGLVLPSFGFETTNVEGYIWGGMKPHMTSLRWLLKHRLRNGAPPPSPMSTASGVGGP